MSGVAFITGASRGIGRAVAEGLIKDGWDLALVGRDSKTLNKAATELTKVGDSKIATYSIDVANAMAVRDAVTDTEARLGPIKVLFNNAGVFLPGSLEIRPEDLELLMATNLNGAINVLQAVVPGMKSRRAGHIFNVSSLCGKHGFPGIGIYCATKFALSGLNESLFHELVPQGVKVTALCPSWVNTDMAAHAPMPPAERIQTSDIFKTVKYLMSLSPAACVKEVVVACKFDIN